MERFSYALYGLGAESWLPFPELVLAMPGAAVDFHILRGSVPMGLPVCRYAGARYQGAPQQLLAYLDDVGRFLARNGNEILVEPDPNANEAELRGAVLASPLAALLMQRGFIVLHASSVATPRGAVVFTGNSCSGKSTLAAWCVKQGWKLISDDITAIRIDEQGVGHVSPGHSQISLWPDIAARFFNRPRAPISNSISPKVTISCGEQFQSTTVPLFRIYQIDVDHSLGVRLDRPLAGHRSAILVSHTYRRQFLIGMDLTGPYKATLSKLSQNVELVRLSRGRDSTLVDRAGEVIAADLAK